MRDQMGDYVAHLHTSFGFVRRNRASLALILMSMALLRLWATTERPFAQPHLTTFGYNPEQISYLSMVGEVGDYPAANPEPCVTGSRHTAPQMTGSCHEYHSPRTSS